METGQYEIDTEMLKYWALGLTAVLAVSGMYIADFSPDFLSGAEDESQLEVEFDKRPLEPNELTTVTVKLDGENVQGATVRADSLNVGETNRNGKLMFRGLEDDFPVNVSYDGYYRVEDIEVDDDASETREASDGSNQDNQDESSGSEENSEGSEYSNNSSNNQDSQDSDDGSDDGSDSEEGFTGFRLDSDPVAEETNRLTLLENGEFLSDQNVQLNGEPLGETTGTGGLTFRVPNAQEITLQASGIEDTLTVSGYEDEGPETGYVQASMTRSGMAYVGETMTLNASSTESDNPIEYYNWTLDHENFNDTLRREVVEYTIPERGPYDITLQVEDTGGFTDSDTGYMNADPEYSGPDIILTSPSEGDTVRAEHNFEFQVDNARTGQEAQIVVGEKVEASTPLEPGLNILEGEDAVTTPITSEGNVDYQIKVVDQGGEWSSETREIENTRAYRDFGTFSIESPADGVEASSPVTFDFSLNLKTGVELEISGSEIEGVEDFSNSTTLNEDQGSYSFNQEINSSQYQWQASISVPSTTESETLEPRELTVN